MLRRNHDEPTQSNNPQGQHSSALPEQAQSLQKYPMRASFITTVNTNTSASSELLTTPCAVKNQTCYVKCCIAHRFTSTSYRQVVKGVLANNTSQNKPTQQKPRQLFKCSRTCKHVGDKVSSNCALGLQPRHAGSRTVPKTPALARVRWRHLAMPGLKACAQPDTRPTARPCTGLSKALQFKVRTSRCASNHDEPTRPRNPHSQHTIAPGSGSVRKSTVTTEVTQASNTSSTVSSELLTTTAAVKKGSCHVKCCLVHRLASTAALRRACWGTTQARTSRHNAILPKSLKHDPKGA